MKWYTSQSAVKNILMTPAPRESWILRKLLTDEYVLVDGYLRSSLFQVRKVGMEILKLITMLRNRRR